MGLIELLFQGRWALFFMIMIALIISLTFHEFGHAFMAKRFGDDTAERAGRLTLNPIAHLDPMGLMMVIFAGFGWAKPVPTDPRNFTSRWADLAVSAAGPLMNLLLAFLAINFFLLAQRWNLAFLQGANASFFFEFFAWINLVLMIFNLVPLGALDGHYILPYFLSRKWGYYYRLYNAQYGNLALMGLVMLSILGNVPIFGFIRSIGTAILPLIAIF